METKEYRWVQVITSLLSDGNMSQLIGTTSSEDRTHGLAELEARHLQGVRARIGEPKILVTTCCFMDSSGKMFGQINPITMDN
jgi:hypothetical protein